MATLGTAITPDQARKISQYAKTVIIAYDSDAAGQAATQKAMRHFSEVGIETKILRMQGAKDPDEYIRKFGAERFRMLLEGSEDAINFQLDRCEMGLDLQTENGSHHAPPAAQRPHSQTHGSCGFALAVTVV